MCAAAAANDAPLFVMRPCQTEHLSSRAADAPPTSSAHSASPKTNPPRRTDRWFVTECTHHRSHADEGAPKSAPGVDRMGRGLMRITAAELRELFPLEDGVVGYHLGDGNIIIRTPNATISIRVSKDRLGHDVTTTAFVPDDPFAIGHLVAAPGNEAVFTIHPETASQQS